VTAIVVALTACGSSGSRASSGSPRSSSNAATTGDRVDLKLIAYKPAQLTVPAGATVAWHQMDPGVHTVTAGAVSQDGGSVQVHPDGTFDSGELATGKTFTHRFTEPGTYTYFCRIHPATMRGEITVR
jgi:plastocyanin